MLLLLCIAAHAQTSLLWTVQDKAFQPGDTVTSEFRVSNFDSIAAYQFAVKFDTALLHFATVTLPDPAPMPMGNLDDSMFIDLGDTLFFPDCIQGDFGMCKSHLGEIRTVWTNPFSSTVEDATLIFRLHFIAKASGNLSQSLRIAPEILPSIAYTFYLVPVPLILSFVDTGTDSADEQLDNNNQLLPPAYPNPTTGQTIIPFVLPDDCRVTLRVFDAAGRLVRAHSGNYAPGAHQVAFDFSGIAPGILHCQLSTSTGGSVSQKLVLR